MNLPGFKMIAKKLPELANFYSHCNRYGRPFPKWTDFFFYGTMWIWGDLGVFWVRIARCGFKEYFELERVGLKR